MATLRITKTGFSEVYRPKDGPPRVQIILVHGLQGHPYKTWRSDPAKYRQDEPLEQIPNWKERLFSRGTKLKSKSKDKGKRPKHIGEEERGDVQQDDTTISVAESGSHEEESLTIAIDDERPFKKNGIYWPLDLLAEKCPRARICVYGYDTLIAGYGRVNKNNLYQIAKDFLYELPLHRSENTPLLFVAHSLGGLVVKESLILARALILSSDSHDPELKSIATATETVVFMGTPHKGSKHWASKGAKAREIANALFMDNNPALLDTLGLKNGEVFRSADKFTELWEESGFTVKTYIEDRSIIGKEKIVPDESSLLGNLKERAIALTGDHSQICKFNGKDDTNWLKVGPQLQRYYQEAMASAKFKEDISTSEESVQEFLEALDNVDLADAEYEISLPIDGTCEWIFNESFFSWIDDPEQSTLLCIHGSLGSGKSTLMRHVAMCLKNSSFSPKKCIASFFNGSPEGGVYHNTPAEIYRSLLVQLLRTLQFREDASELVNAQKSKLLLRQEVPAHQQELCEVLRGLFLKRRLEQTIIFIDAVDKCTDPDALVQFFQDIAPIAPATKLKICFTSQQTFPILGSHCKHIAIENHNDKDITSYVEKRLPVGSLLSREQEASLQRSIKEKASGIFLWVVLVVNILREHLNNGKDANFLHAVLEETPKQLTKLYHNIIARSDIPIEHPTMMHVMQWVLFAARPLTAGEWHHVFAFIDNPCLQSIHDWKCSTTYTESDSLLLQRIKHVCRGLVDVKDRQVPVRPWENHSEDSSLKGGAGSFESHQYIDVIHSSVREFFLGDGFALLDSRIKNASGEGHAYILEVCIRYCFLEEMKKAFNFPSGEKNKKVRRRRKPRKNPHLAKSAKSSVPSKADVFEDTVRAAMEDTSSDSSETMSLGSSAGLSILSFRSNKSLRRHQPANESKRNAFNSFIKSTSTPLISLEGVHRNDAIFDYLDGLELPNQDTPGVLTRRDTDTSKNTPGSWIEDFKVADDPPSFWQYCQSMLVYHAVAADKSCTVPEKALEFLLSQDIKAWAETRKDMQHGATLEYFAARWNLVSWLQYLGKKGPLNPRGGLLRYPIIVAAKKNNLEAFECLVNQENPVDLSCVDSRGRTTIHYAAMSPNSAILPRIRELGIAHAFTIVNMPDKEGRTALHLAAFYASNNNIKELLSIGADVDYDDDHSNTPLHLACLRKTPDLLICKALVEAGCAHRQRNINMRTPLQLAQELGHSQLVDYLTTLEPDLSHSISDSDFIYDSTPSRKKKFVAPETPLTMSASLNSLIDDERTPLTLPVRRRRRPMAPNYKRVASVEQQGSRSRLRSCFCCF